MQCYHSRKRGDTAAKHSTYNINRPVTAGVLADLQGPCRLLLVVVTFLLVVVTCAVPALITALKLVVGGRVGVQLPGVDPSAVPPNQILSLRAFNLGLEAQQRMPEGLISPGTRFLVESPTIVVICL